MPKLFHSILIAASVLCLAGAASAATFVFTAEVESLTESGTSPGNPVIPPIGAAGTVTFEIDDSDPLLPIFDPDPVSGVFTASVSVPGYLEGEAVFVDYLSSFTSTASYLQFTTYGDTSYEDTGSFPITVPDGYHTFRIDYGAPLIGAPVTVGDVVAGLSVPGSMGFFRHEIVLVNEESDSIATVRTTVSFPADTDVPEVPLPAAGWMLLGGLLAMRLAARRG